MSNGQLHDDKLFQGLHDRLSDYEAPYDGADWDDMSRSLDKLPKTNYFRWKFSLNTIGIVLGIIGLTVFGVVVASGNGKSGNSTENKNVSVKQTTTPVVNEDKATVVPAVAPSTVVANTESAASPVAINTVKDLKNRTAKKEIANNDFYFGDQIDPAKGFVHATSEDAALLDGHSDLKKPVIYYDIENNKIKPIFIPNDSAEQLKEIPLDSVSVPAIQPEPAAPTDGQRIGFDQPH